MQIVDEPLKLLRNPPVDATQKDVNWRLRSLRNEVKKRLRVPSKVTIGPIQK